MRFLATLRSPAGLLALLSVSALPALALIKFDDSHDEIFVAGSAGVAYDSDIFASSTGGADTSYNASLDLEYKRNAGMLGVDVDLGWDFSHFSHFTNEDFADPRVSAELTKNSGRTTGSLKLDVKRADRTDTVINARTQSWDTDLELNVKYPVIERYSISGNLGYTRQDFTNDTLLVDLDTYTAAADLLYALNSTRNLLVGYRYRATQTAADTSDQDHALTVGVDGKIVGKFNGSARIGFQERDIARHDGHHESHGSLTANLSTTWTVTRRLSMIGEASRDFSTAATDVSVDSTNLSLTAQFAVNAKLVAFTGITFGHVDFIDQSSLGRRDNSVSYNAGFSYTYSERMKLSLTYVYTHNWSTFAFADYNRNALSLNVSSRW